MFLVTEGRPGVSPADQIRERSRRAVRAGHRGGRRTTSLLDSRRGADGAPRKLSSSVCTHSTARAARASRSGWRRGWPGSVSPRSDRTGPVRPRVPRSGRHRRDHRRDPRRSRGRDRGRGLHRPRRGPARPDRDGVQQGGSMTAPRSRCRCPSRWRRRASSSSTCCASRTRTRPSGSRRSVPSAGPSRPRSSSARPTEEEFAGQRAARAARTCPLWTPTWPPRPTWCSATPSSGRPAPATPASSRRCRSTSATASLGLRRAPAARR